MGSDTRPIPADLTGYVLTSATAADVPEVVALEAECYPDPWPVTAFAALPANERVFFQVARADERGGSRLLGYVIGWFVMDEGELANLAVTPEARGRGIGRAMLQSLIDDATRRGVGDLYLEVRESNAAARGLYLAFGFEEIGRRRGYYRRPVEDALVLRRRLRA